VNTLISFFTSSIGRKWIVALTGLVMLGYVVGHLIGNLQIFLQPHHINKYAAFLQGLGEFLWIIRLALLATVILHIVFTIQLAIENRRGRPQDYAMQRTVQAKLSTKTMVWSGAYLLCFIIVHLLHLTAQTIHPEYRTWHDEGGRHDVYRMMIAGFRDPLMSAFYIVGMILLCAHLAHGIGSLCQTLGVRTKHAAALLTQGGRIVAWLLAIGYISIPTAILFAGHGKKYLDARQALDQRTAAARAVEQKP